MRGFVLIVILLTGLSAYAQPYFTYFDLDNAGSAAIEVLNTGYLTHTGGYTTNNIHVSLIQQRDLNGNVIHEYAPFDTNYFSQPYGEMCLKLFPDSSYLVMGMMDTTQAQNFDHIISRFKKFDKYHNEIWSKDYFGNYDTHDFKQLKKLSTGNYALVGFTIASAGMTSQGLVVIFDSDFSILNSYNYGGPDIDLLMSLEEVPGTGMLIGGREFVTGIGWVSTLRLINYSGNEIWKKEWSNGGVGTYQYQYCNVEYMKDNTIFMSCMRLPSFNSVLYSTIVEKLDLEGNVIWEGEVTDQPTFYSLACLKPFELEDGGIMLYGFGKSTGDVQSLAITRLNPLGEKVWVKKYAFDPTSYDILYEFEKIDNDNFVFTGTFTDANNIQNGSLTRINCNGEDGTNYPLSSTCLSYDCSLYPMSTGFTASKTFLDLSQESGWVDFENISPNTISREWHMNDGTIYYTDDSPSHEFIYNGIYYVKLISNHGSCTDTTWATIEVVNGLVGTDEFEKSTFRIFPNPTTGMIRIDASMSLQTIEMYSLTGQKVYSKQVEGKQHICDLPAVEKGLYQLVLTTVNGEKRTEKLIIQ